MTASRMFTSVTTAISIRQTLNFRIITIQYYGLKYRNRCINISRFNNMWALSDNLHHLHYTTFVEYKRYVKYSLHFIVMVIEIVYLQSYWDSTNDKLNVINKAHSFTESVHIFFSSIKYFKIIISIHLKERFPIVIFI